MRRFTFESLRSAFEPVLRNTLQDEHDRRTTWLEDQLSSLEGELAAWTEEVHEKDLPTSAALEKLLTTLLQWSSELVVLPVSLELDRTFDRWESRYQHIIADVPGQIEFPLDKKEYRRIRKGDSLRVIFWRIRFAIRMLFRPKKRGIIIRNINVPDFLRMHLGQLVMETLTDQWVEQIETASNQIRPTHVAIVDKIRSMLPEEEEETSGVRSLPRLHMRQIVEEILELTAGLTPMPLDLELATEEIIEEMEFYWTFAGTSILPANTWRGYRWRRYSKQLLRHFKKLTHRWIQILLLRGDELGKDLDLLRLELRSRRMIENIASTIPDRIERDTLPEFERLREQLKGILATARELEDYDSMKAFLSRDARHLLEHLRRDRLNAVADKLLDTKLEAMPDEVLIEIRTGIDAMNPVRYILSKLDTKPQIPKYRFTEMPITQTIKLDQYDRLRRGLFRFTQLTTGSISEMSIRITDIEHLLQFALETSSNLLGRRRDEAQVKKARTELVNGYKRALQQVEELQKEVGQLGKTTVDAISSRLIQFQGGIRELIDNDRALVLQTRALKANAKHGFARLGASISGGFGGFGNGIKRVFDFLFGWVRGAYIDIRRLSGLDVPTSTVDPRLLKLISDAQEQITHLPLVYRRIFRLHPLDDERFFVSREKELTELARQAELWRQGQVASTAIIGERGSGRTTLLRIALKRIFNEDKIFWIDLEQTLEDADKFAKHLSKALRMGKITDIDKIEEKLLEGDPAVIVFEDVHNLFLRTVDGFEALERFLLLVARTSSKIFWIMTCTTFSWSYLDKVMGIGGHLQWVLQLSNLSTEEITNALMRRSRASGFKTRVEPNERALKSKTYKRLRSEEERQRYLLSYFFGSLSRFAVGNITVAILFWLHSIRGNDSGVLRLAPDISFDSSFIRSFHPDDLFTMQALAVHEFLDAAQHARVFHQDVSVSRTHLSRLRNMGVLEESTGGFRIHPFLYRPIIEVLKERNMLP